MFKIDKTSKRRHWCRSRVFIVNFENIPHLYLCFYYWPWAYICLLDNPKLSILSGRQILLKILRTLTWTNRQQIAKLSNGPTSISLQSKILYFYRRPFYAHTRAIWFKRIWRCSPVGTSQWIWPANFQCKDRTYHRQRYGNLWKYGHYFKKWRMKKAIPFLGLCLSSFLHEIFETCHSV